MFMKTFSWSFRITEAELSSASLRAAVQAFGRVAFPLLDDNDSRGTAQSGVSPNLIAAAKPLKVYRLAG